jgi:DNA replication protein DnaC
VHIVGPVGTGKSHLAQAIGHQAVKLGHEVHFVAPEIPLNH